MLPQKNNVAPIRNQIIVKIAESFIKDRFANADKIPEMISPEGSIVYHASREIDRDIIKKIAMAVMGFVPADEEGSEKSLNEYGQEALKADVIQCLEVVGEIHVPLAQGQLDEGGIPQHIALHHAVEDFRVHIVEAAAIFGVGVDDVVL